MPWCPQCGVEYREGIESCSDCGVFLAEHPPEPAVEMVWREDKLPLTAPLALLVRTSSAIETEEKAALLESAGILVRRQAKGEAYVRSMVGTLQTTGADLYVPEDKLLEARELLEAFVGPGSEELPKSETAEEPMDDRRFPSWVRVAVMIAAILAFLLVGRGVYSIW